jgi:hypothetical protein
VQLPLDGAPHMLQEDLALTGLPAHIEEESDDDNDDDYSAPAEPVYMNNYAVSPRELTRLLHKLQDSLTVNKTRRAHHRAGGGVTNCTDSARIQREGVGAVERLCTAPF